MANNANMARPRAEQRKADVNEKTTKPSRRQVRKHRDSEMGTPRQSLDISARNEAQSGTRNIAQLRA